MSREVSRRTFLRGSLTAAAEDVGQGPILIYPFNRDKFTAPLFRVPDERHFFVFALLRNAVPPTPEHAAGLVADNRALFERATEVGGKRYPFDSVPMTKQDWQRHYQPAWGQLASAKHAYDPEGILTPGQGIFRARRGLLVPAPPSQEVARQLGV